MSKGQRDRFVFWYHELNSPSVVTAQKRFGTKFSRNPPNGMFAYMWYKLLSTSGCICEMNWAEKGKNRWRKREWNSSGFFSMKDNKKREAADIYAWHIRLHTKLCTLVSHLKLANNTKLSKCALYQDKQVCYLFGCNIL